MRSDAQSESLTSISYFSTILVMRTTISLDDDIVPVVKRYAAQRSVALGKAVSDLVRRGLTVPCPTRVVNGVTVFDLPDDSPRVTSAKVTELDAEQE
jgi:hypothetical protein